MIFLDGVGLGQPDPAVNPFLRARLPVLTEVLGGHALVMNGGPFDSGQATLIPTDATLGIEGLPQSATGQTAILTGVNAAQELGHHWGPHPNEPLRQIIGRESIFKKLIEQEGQGAFANAYPERYFKEVERGKRGLPPPAWQQPPAACACVITTTCARARRSPPSLPTRAGARSWATPTCPILLPAKPAGSLPGWPAATTSRCSSIITPTSAAITGTGRKPSRPWKRSMPSWAACSPAWTMICWCLSPAITATSKT